MRKQSFVVFVGFFSMAGCGSATFLVATDNSPDASNDSDSEIKYLDGSTNVDGGTDANADTQEIPDAPVVCDPFSCAPECGTCEAGTMCGTAGQNVCGGNNCGSWIQEAGVSCTGSLSHLFQCIPRADPDVMPGCTFKGTASGQNWYCCK